MTLILTWSMLTLSPVGGNLRPTALGHHYYQIHYYDWMRSYSTDNLYALRAEALRLDRPVIVGEFPGNLSAVATLGEYLDTWYANGYAGAWPWSFRSDESWGSPDPGTFRGWALVHQAAIDIPPAQPVAGTTPTAATVTYTVESGDSLSFIAVRFNTTVQP